jgi:hypothetical protein
MRPRPTKSAANCKPTIVQTKTPEAKSVFRRKEEHIHIIRYTLTRVGENQRWTAEEFPPMHKTENNG